MKDRAIASNGPNSRASANQVPFIQLNSTPSASTVQLKTVIKHFKGNLNVMGGQRTVGLKMTSFLDPYDPVVGSATGVNTDWMRSIRKSYPKANVVRGHLLNHDLGGFAIEENLFPISTKANSDHSTKVEQKVKGALTEVYEGGGFVTYDVNVNQVKSYERAQFICEWRAFNKNKKPFKGEKVAINSDLGNHVGGFGGWGKTKKSPHIWRHGKSKGGTEVESVRKRIVEANKQGNLIFAQQPTDHKGKVKGGPMQDSLEFLNDLVEEYGALGVYKAIIQARKMTQNKGLQLLYTSWMNKLAQRKQLTIHIFDDPKTAIDLTGDNDTDMKDKGH